MTVSQILSQATFYSDGQDYVLLKLHPRGIILAAGIIAEIAHPFSALIADKDEVTLLIANQYVEEFQDRLRDYQAGAIYRLITIDVELEPSLTGFIAHISAALAKASIPILPFAAYSRDHLFVPAEQFERAIATLEKLKSEA